jgi:hypothetical protein
LQLFERADRFSFGDCGVNVSPSMLKFGGLLGNPRSGVNFKFPHREVVWMLLAQL